MYQIFSSLCCLFSLSWFIGMHFVFSSLRLICLLLYIQGYCHIGKHRIWICSLIVWLGRWAICPVFSTSNQFFSLLSDNIENWMPVKYQRVSKREVGAKHPGSALADSSIWGGEFTPGDLDLKNPVEDWARVASWSLNVK